MLSSRLFRAKQHVLPEKLQELVPEYLLQVPIDPYSDRPLIYRPEADGYRLYSVGHDGRDDGGRFGGPADALFGTGFDFDLEIYNR